MKPIIYFILISIISNNLLSKEFIVSNISEFNSAVLSVQPGDTITLKNGTWNNVTLRFKGTGTETKRILLRAQSLGGVILSGSSSLKIDGKYLTVDGLTFTNGFITSGSVIEFRDSQESSYCRLTNTSIIDYNPSDSSKDVKWVSLYGKYNRVDHCYLKGKKNMGTTLVVWLSATPNYHLIDHNYFGPRPVLYDNGGESIRVGTSDWSMYDSYTTVEYNVFEKCDGEIEVISNKSCENTYRYNTFISCQGMLTLRHGNRCYVYNNYFFANNVPNSGGIRIIGEDHKVYNNYVENTAGTSMKAGITLVNGIPNSALNEYFQVKRAEVCYNTLVGNRMSINIGAGKSSTQNLPPLDCKIANNIIQGTVAPLVTFTDNPINMRWFGNIFYGASIGFTLPVGNMSTDPKLITDPVYNMKRLGSVSPAIGAAVDSFPYVTVDFDGQERVPAKDIGADQFSTMPVLIKPLMPTDVGPGTEITSVKDNKTLTPKDFILNQNYPNPFNPVTTIAFYIPEGKMLNNIKIKIYDILGNHIETLIDNNIDYLNLKEGKYSVRWDASGYSSGTYYYELSTGDYREIKKMVLLK